MKRREFVAGLGGAVVWPVAARAQQAAMPVIGFLSASSPDTGAGELAAFRKGLGEAGYIEGRNVLIEYRWAEGDYDRLPALAGDLVRHQVAVIAANGPAAAAAKAATTTVPIVFTAGFDPVAVGLVASPNRPGGNLTGVTNLGIKMGSKRLELLHGAVPTTAIIALLVNPAGPAADSQSREIQAAARTVGLQLHILQASSERDFESVFATLVQLSASGLVIGPDALFTSQSKHLAELALRHAVPAIYQFRGFAAAGGLMSYGGNLTDNYRLIGVYTGRILKGEKPANLPVQQTTRVELIINMRRPRRSASPSRKRCWQPPMK